jgi:BCD family chlorophyll transporter-like MFS transporter
MGFGAGMFAVGTLTSMMSVAKHHDGGIALGAWGAVTATAAGLSIAVGGALRDAVSALGSNGMLGPALAGNVAGYTVVYHVEILLLFIALVVVGPLARHSLASPTPQPARFGLPAYPG